MQRPPYAVELALGKSGALNPKMCQRITPRTCFVCRCLQACLVRRLCQTTPCQTSPRMCPISASCCIHAWIALSGTMQGRCFSQQRREQDKLGATFYPCTCSAGQCRRRKESQVVEDDGLALHPLADFTLLILFLFLPSLLLACVTQMAERTLQPVHTAFCVEKGAWLAIPQAMGG